MTRTVWIGVLAVLTFVGILLVRMPANWLASALPAGVRCGEMRGSVWNGACDALSIQHTAWGNLTWQLHPLSLLSGAVVAQIAIDGPAGTAAGQVAARSGARLVARNLTASFPLNPALIAALPSNLSGNVHTNLALLRLKNGVIEAIEGRIEVRDLQRRGGEIAQLGDYAVTFPEAAGAEPVGDLHSLKGPLDVEGKLKLTREPGFVLEGTVAAGASASADVIQQLSALGAPDARGRRPFSVAGTF